MIECPLCSSKTISRIIAKGDFTEEGIKKGFRDLDTHPLRPAMEFECEECKHRWENPEYVKYLLVRSIC